MKTEMGGVGIPIETKAMQELDLRFTTVRNKLKRIQIRHSSLTMLKNTITGLDNSESAENRSKLTQKLLR